MSKTKNNRILKFTFILEAALFDERWIKLYHSKSFLIRLKKTFLAFFSS